MATVHSLNNLQNDWRIINQEDNANDLGKIHEPSGHNVSAIYASEVANGRYAGCVWEDSDGDLRITVYDRTNAEEETLEVNGGDHSRAFLQTASTDHFVVFCQDSANTQWFLYLYKYDPNGSPNKLTLEDSQAVTTADDTVDHLHSMAMLTDSLGLLSYVSNATGNEVSASQINVDTGAGSISIDGTNNAQRLTQTDDEGTLTLGKINSTQAVAYYENIAAVVTVTDGTSIAIATGEPIHGRSAAYHVNIRPAISLDGSVVAGTHAQDGAESVHGLIGACQISGTSISSDDATQDTTRPNLLHEDTTTGPIPRSMGTSCIFLNSLGVQYNFAVIGNMPNPIKNFTEDNSFGMIVSIKSNGTRFPLFNYGGTFELPAKSSTHPVLASINEDSFIGFYIDTGDDLAATEISRFPY